MAGNGDHDAGWTAGEVETLRRMTDEKQLVRDIANALRRPVGSVIAKRYRLQLVKMGNRHKEGNGHIVGRTSGRQNPGTWTVDGGAVARYEALPLPPDAVCIPVLELTETSCRFPVGKEMLVCGAEWDPKNRPYCTFHARIAFKTLA